MNRNLEYDNPNCPPQNLKFTLPQFPTVKIHIFLILIFFLLISVAANFLTTGIQGFIASKFHNNNMGWKITLIDGIILIAILLILAYFFKIPIVSFEQNL